MKMLSYFCLRPEQKKDNKLAFPKKEGMLRLEKIDKTMYSFLETEKVLVKIPSPGVSR